MRIEEQSKSLNEIIASFSDADKSKIRQWWRRKLFIAYSLAGFSALLAFVFTFALVSCRP